MFSATWPEEAQGSQASKPYLTEREGHPSVQVQNLACEPESLRAPAGAQKRPQPLEKCL